MYREKYTDYNCFFLQSLAPAYLRIYLYCTLKSIFSFFHFALVVIPLVSHKRDQECFLANYQNHMILQ